MSDFYTEQNFDESDIYYQIEIPMCDAVPENIDLITDTVFDFCELPQGYSKINIKARLLLSYEQDKPVTIDFDEDFDKCQSFFKELTECIPLFIRDNFFKRVSPTYISKRR